MYTEPLERQASAIGGLGTNAGEEEMHGGRPFLNTSDQCVSWRNASFQVGEGECYWGSPVCWTLAEDADTHSGSYMPV